MIGADRYAKLFETGQYGKFYFVSYRHARGDTFKIFILPEGEEAIGNGKSNAPLNENAVEVYGVISGNPGWTECYGWLYNGKWVKDFNELVKNREAELAEINHKNNTTKIDCIQQEELRVKKLLEAY